LRAEERAPVEAGANAAAEPARAEIRASFIILFCSVGVVVKCVDILFMSVLQQESECFFVVWSLICGGGKF
jgi:hypothetical protein